MARQMYKLAEWRRNAQTMVWKLDSKIQMYLLIYHKESIFTRNLFT